MDGAIGHRSDDCRGHRGDALKNRTPFLTRTALAISASLALTAIPATGWALGLGRLSVQSAIGEVLRAEIDVASLAPDEASTLVVRIAPPEAYRAAGVDYNAALAGAKATLARRADGRPYVRVTGERVVQEPFVDVIVELSWASGKLVREFTVLLDPPGSRPAPPVQAVAPVAPVIAAAPTPSAAAKPAPAAAPKPAPAAVAKPRAPAAETAPPAAVQGGGGPDEYRVRAGDTLSRVAVKTQRPGVSLDQMLVGLFRANPDAFLQENMNLLKAGSVLAVPAGETLKAIPAAEARGVIQAHSTDFNSYRRSLAGGAPAAPADESTRKAKGRVTAAVDDRKQPAAGPTDKLKLSGGSVQASAPEAQLSKAAAARDSASRVAELARNVDELKRLQQGTAAAQSAGTAAATGPATPASAPGPAPAAMPSSAPAAGPAIVAKAPVAPSAPARPSAASAPAAGPAVEPSIVEALTDSPYLLPGAGALVLALLGFGLYRQRAKAASKERSDTSFLESRAQPDSFFGATGGQRVDTSDASSGASSMGFSLSQLDAIGDVDPVAEADVYLAYGRDLQAEEILKEAMRASPDRLAVRTKLLEVYAKRRDVKGFELLAVQLYALAKGTGPDWEKAQALGRQLEPDNPMYQPGGAPRQAIRGAGGEFVEPLSATTMPATVAASRGASQFAPSQAEAPGATGPVDLDLDIGLPGDAPESPMEATRPFTPQSLSAGPDSGPVDFDLTAVEPRDSQHGGLPSMKFELDSMRMDLPTDDAPTIPTSSSARPAAPVQPPAATQADFGGFMLSGAGELGEVPAPAAAQASTEVDAASDPIARKLELAEEFRQIGDLEGARDLLEEVIEKATGSLKEKARRMLDRLG